MLPISSSGYQHASLFTAPQNATEKSESNKGLCNRIKNVILRIFRTFVYYLTCTKVNWLNTKVKPKPSTFLFMKQNHCGEGNKLSFTTKSGKECKAWVKGESLIVETPRPNDGQVRAYTPEKPITAEFEFNSSGEVTKIAWEGVKADKERHNSIYLRELFHALDEKSNKKIRTRIIPMLHYNTSEEKIAIRLKLMESHIHGQAISMTQPQVTPDKLKFSCHETSDDFYFLEIEGGKFFPSEEPAKARISIHDSTGKISDIEVGGKKINDIKDVPELEIWLDMLFHAVEER